MKKWNRVLAILLAAGLTAGLCGCGSGADNPSSLPPAPNSQAVEDVPTPTPTPTPEPTPEPTPTPEPEPHGLVLAEYRQGGNATGKYVDDVYVVYCLNPETGEATVLSRFDNSETPSDGRYQIGGHNLTSNMGTLFSDDFSKIICEKTLSGGEQCAGWFDTDGNFFNVTGALGLQRKSDFDDMVRYTAIGFSNGLFGFAKSETSTSYTYYYVPVDNINPAAIREGDVRMVGHPYNEYGGILKEGYFPKYRPEDVTSWIDDTHCIVNNSYAKASGKWMNSIIVDTANETETKYVPGNSHSSWDGIVSPDGTQIAFMSKLGPKNGDSEADIYIIPIHGGDPAKASTGSFSLGNTLPGVNYVNYGLIGWI